MLELFFTGLNYKNSRGNIMNRVSMNLNRSHPLFAQIERAKLESLQYAQLVLSEICDESNRILDINRLKSEHAPKTLSGKMWASIKRVVIATPDRVYPENLKSRKNLNPFATDEQFNKAVEILQETGLITATWTRSGNAYSIMLTEKGKEYISQNLKT